MSLVYLASPYSHEDPLVMERRYRAAVRAAGILAKTDHAVFAPIAHSHEIGRDIGTSTDHEFWMRQDLPVLERCDVLAVLSIDGHMTSRGVREEVAFAKREGIPVIHFLPASFGLDSDGNPYHGEFDEAGSISGLRHSIDHALEEAIPEAIPLASIMPAQWKPTNPKDAIGIRKPPMSTVPMNVVAEIGVAMLEGACKYGRHNYRGVGVRASVYFDATMRHLVSWWEGEDIDPDSGASHITKALASLAVLRDAQMQGKCTDDRPPRSAPFFPRLVAESESILDRHAGKDPKHWTIEDEAA